ncbi:hypothetical protein GF377_05870, partial [candidate division GN15 bacterium]|nr:hypothetical protein [candidate division GN15 bacterium]
RKGYDSAVVEPALRMYVRNGLLDDEQLARSLAQRFFDRKPAGKPWLVAALQKKHIPREIAESVVEGFLLARDETTSAVAALRPKWTRLAQLDVESARRKAYTYLSRRGFGYAAAKTAFETLHAQSDEGPDHQDG